MANTFLPRATSHPVLDDVERAEIGTLYATSPFEARRLGAASHRVLHVDLAPWSSADAKGLLRAAIRDPNPVIFLENEILYGRSFEVPVLEDFTIPFGKARIWREGSEGRDGGRSVVNDPGRAAERIERMPLRLSWQSAAKTRVPGLAAKSTPLWPWPL